MKVCTTSTGFSRRSDGRRALDQLREPEEQFEVAREGAGDAGAQYLDRDRAAVGRDREMNLRDRRRGDRHIVE